MDSIQSIQVDGVTYWLPANTDDVATLIQDAKTNNEIICLRGAAHSFPLIGNLEKAKVSASGRAYKYVMLSNMYAVSIDAPNMKVTVDAGCHLGPDPWDPTGTSTLQNSLLYQLDQVGLAVPDLGGITHQTVGGFLSTASSGGTTQFGFDEALLSIDIMYYDKKTNKVLTRTFTRPPANKPNPDDPFYAAGVATMGLFGIIVSATFQCCAKFYIAGSETTCSTALPGPGVTNGCIIDLFGPGVPAKGNTPAILSLQQFLEQKQIPLPPAAPFDTVHFSYSRFLWWPQAGVSKVVIWQAQRTDEAGAMAWASKDGKLTTYQEVPWVMGSPTPVTLGADLLYSAIGNWPDWLLTLMGNTPQYQQIKGLIEELFYPVIFPLILNNIFLKPGVQNFADDWYTGLPMDNQMSDKLFPVWFTELWIPIDQAANVMNDLQTYYSSGGCQTTGDFSCEIYAAKNCPFWLSPAYNTDVIRIDVFWFGNNKADPRDFYQGFWDVLAKYKYRPHWGKYLPAADGAQGVNYLKSVYPKWNDWMAIREQMDPYQLFVNDYWHSHLGIPEA